MDESNANREVVDWLILIRAKGIPPIKLREMLSIIGHPAQITCAESEQLSRIGLSQSTIDSILAPDWNDIEADLGWLNEAGNHFISYLDPDYPELLRQITDPPLGLFIRGSIDMIGCSQIAIVGSRNPTAGGRRIAMSFAEALGTNGLTITSGLALGIDSAAHLGALNAGAPTIAVLGNGIDTIYPAINQKLADRIVDNGALVSEFPLFTRPLPQNFPRRNRIISGLSVGIVVVEAALKSGSLITARHAMEQGREVFAVPGSIQNPLTRGCHALIRDGAKLTENIEHILEEIGQLDALVRQAHTPCSAGDGENERLDEQSKLLLDNIGYEPVTIDLLVEETGISANLTAATLQKLELQNLIESLPGGSFARKN